MALSFYGLLEAALLVLNGIAVLHRQRFINKYLINEQHASFEQQSNQPGVKAQLISLILAVQTVMRMPLIAVNIFVIIFKLLLG